MTRAVLFILNFNGTKITCDFLKSLRAGRIPFPVWVVDNGSDRDDSPAFEEAFPGVIVRRIDVNCGFAGGVNRAMEMAEIEGYDYSDEINNDTLAENDFLSPCVEIMEHFPDVDIVSSRTKTLDRATGEFSIWGFCSGPDDLGRYRDGFHETRHVTGCGMLLRVCTFREFGGLDERFFCYGEENDYCYRIAKAGRRQGFALNSLILHQGSLTNDSVCRCYFAARNTILFFAKTRFLLAGQWEDSRETRPPSRQERPREPKAMAAHRSFRIQHGRRPVGTIREKNQAISKGSGDSSVSVALPAFFRVCMP